MILPVASREAIDVVSTIAAITVKVDLYIGLG